MEGQKWIPPDFKYSRLFDPLGVLVRVQGMPLDALLAPRGDRMLLPGAPWLLKWAQGYPFVTLSVGVSLGLLRVP